MKNKYTHLKLACYSSNICMSIVGSLSPLLFLTFKENYGISYSLLGLLVVINFFTQLCIDLIFSFFSHKFNIKLTVTVMPLLTAFGIFVYAVWPFVFRDNIYIGLVIGTVIFSLAAGLGEVLLSPVIAAIPAENPEHEMSKLHSIFAWGVVAVIIISTLFLKIFGNENWQWLAIIYIIVPLFSFSQFLISEIPPMKTPERVSGALKLLKNSRLWLCVGCIFLGGAAECTMSQWCSSYLEQALGIEKIWGDIFGAALFALMLGLGRTLYSKIGKDITRVLLLGAVGATLCYIITALSPIPVLGLFACAFTGFCVSMLWPGSLIVGSDNFPESGVFIYAMMAAGGDLGASVAPQLVGSITDIVSGNSGAIAFAESLGIMPEQLGMRVGVLIGTLFPTVAIIFYSYIRKNQKSV